MHENAPDGYAPVVEVFLVGREEPLRLNQVQTRRDDFSWVFLIADTSEVAEYYVPDDRLVLVHESLISRG